MFTNAFLFLFTGGHVAIWNYYRALKVPGSILSAPTALRFIALGSGFGGKAKKKECFGCQYDLEAHLGHLITCLYFGKS